MGKDKTYRLFPFANVHKTFGNNGELIIKLFPDAPEEINLKEPVFITIDGYAVPFFFKQFEPRGNHRALIVFDDMETQTLAEELVGKTIELSVNTNDAPSIVNYQLSIINYEVIDETVGKIGTVCNFMDIPGNPCLLVKDGDNEIMIPYREELIVTINHKQKTMITRLPEGLINLNRTLN